MPLENNLSNFEEEIDEIIENLRKVKGPEYINSLFIILNFLNFYSMIKVVTHGNISEGNKAKMTEVATDISVDMFFRVAASIMKTNDIEKCIPIMEEMRKDIETITKKQDEYNTKTERKGN